MQTPIRSALALALPVLLWTGCGHGHEHGPGHEHDHEPEQGSHDEENEGEGETTDHAHEAPHGGALIALGDHLAHVELLVDTGTGKMTAWVLDGHAESGERIAQETLVVYVERAGVEAAPVTLAAVANKLTGEEVGDTSQFEGEDGGLKGLESFTGWIAAIDVKGSSQKDVSFRYPGGNE